MQWQEAVMAHGSLKAWLNSGVACCHFVSCCSFGSAARRSPSPIGCASVREACCCCCCCCVRLHFSESCGVRLLQGESSICAFTFRTCASLFRISCVHRVQTKLNPAASEYQTLLKCCNFAPHHARNIYVLPVLLLQLRLQPCPEQVATGPSKPRRHMP